MVGLPWSPSYTKCPAHNQSPSLSATKLLSSLFTVRVTALQGNILQVWCCLNWANQKCSTVYEEGLSESDNEPCNDRTHAVISFLRRREKQRLDSFRPPAPLQHSPFPNSFSPHELTDISTNSGQEENCENDNLESWADAVATEYDCTYDDYAEDGWYDESA